MGGGRLRKAEGAWSVWWLRMAGGVGQAHLAEFKEGEGKDEGELDDDDEPKGRVTLFRYWPS